MKIYLLLFCIISVSVESRKTTLEKYVKLRNSLAAFVWPTSGHAAALGGHENVTSWCSMALEKLVAGIQNGDKATMRAVDANSKVQSGFLRGAFINYGGYDSCREQYCQVKLHVPLDNRKIRDSIDLSGTPFKGSWLQEIGSFYRVFYNVPMQLGACVPRQCSRQDMELIFNQLSASRRLPIKIELSCDKELPKRSSYEDWMKKSSLSIVTSIILVILGSTMVSQVFADSVTSKYLRNFCIVENTRKLFRPTADGSKHLAFINGYRIIYFFVTAASHAYFVATSTNSFSSTVGMLTQFKRQSFSTRYMTYKSGSLAIGINFVVAGMLSVVSWYPEIIKRNGRISFKMYSMIRFLRPLPVILATILLLISFPESWGSGPIFASTYQNISGNCLTTGWADILGVSNFVPTRDLCLHHGWYMSADLQCYLLSFPILLMIIYKPFKGMAVAILTGSVSIMVHGLWTYKSGASTFWDFSSTDTYRLLSETSLLHFYTTAYISSYMIGLIFGFLVINNIRCDFKHSAILLYAAMFVFFFLAYSLPMLDFLDIPDLMRAFLSPVAKTFTGMALMLLLYLLWLGKMAPFRSLITSRTFELTGRISFSSFMMHYLFIWYENAQTRQPFDYVDDPLSLWMRVISMFICSHIVGYIFHIFFEAPATNLMKFVLSKK
ncbi:Nose resistant to fluoxetine protein 6 [Halotydeus destructor]|nr:Nose resistant to fluoxetine protein 6 [Halotydeus destructor]